MAGPKRFDCVEMKNAIQAKLALEFAGMTARAEAAEVWRRAEADPILGDWLRRWRAARGVPALPDARSQSNAA